MKYKIWYDEEAKTLNLQMLDRLTKDNVHGIMEAVNKELEGREQRYLLVDLSNSSSGMLDKETRQAFKQALNPIDFEKIALFGADPAVRMISKIIIVVSGVSKIAQFFETKAQALAWFKGE